MGTCDLTHMLETESKWLHHLAATLLGRDAEAEDVAQDALMLALRKRPDFAGDRRRARGWLRKVVERMARSKRRSRAELQQRMARLTPVASFESAAEERLEIRDLLLREVRGLAEPYRSTIVMSYFEGLSTEQIAVHKQVSRAAVRQHRSRGIKMLRERLEQCYEQPRDWRSVLALALVPTGLPSTPHLHLSRPWLIGSLFMGSRFIYAGVILILCLAVAGSLSLFDSDEPSVPMNSSSRQAMQTSPVDAVSSPERTPTDGPAPKRDELSAPAAAPASLGSIIVKVRRVDGSPFGDIPVFVTGGRSGDLEHLSRLASTDESGSVRIEEIAPRKVWVSLGRGKDDDTKVIDIEAGKESEVEFELTAGIHVTGRVVDSADSPVAGANVVVSGWGGGNARTLARSDTDGRFALEDLGVNCSIGARAEGYAPSPLRGLTGREGGSMDVTILLPGLGGSLECTVLGTDEIPIAGALVRAGLEGRQAQPIKMRDGARGHLIPLQARTDHDGRVRFQGVAAGAVPVAVRHDGYAPWQGDAQVTRGETAQQIVRLQPCATLTGVARDSAGHPVKRASIIVGRHGRLGHTSTKTDENGEFHIASIPVGDFRIELQGNGVRKTSKLVGIPGRDTRWDPVVPAGRELSGRLVGPDDEPISGASLESYVKAGGWLHARTDSRGRFTLPKVVMGDPLRLRVTVGSIYPMIAFDAVPPSEGELLLKLREDQLPSVHIKGKLVDPDGNPVSNANLAPQMRGFGNTPVLKTEADGSFDYGPYPPGEYRMLITAGGWAKVRSPWRTLKSGEVADLGEIRLEKPGLLAVRMTSGPATFGQAQFRIHNQSGQYVTRLRLVDGIGEVGGLQSGEYELLTMWKGIVATTVPFSIRAGQETRLDLESQAGTSIALVVAVADGAKMPRHIGLIVERGAGARIFELKSSAVKSDGSIWSSILLGPGEYRAQVIDGDRNGEAEFSVSTGDESVKVEVLIR